MPNPITIKILSILATERRIPDDEMKAHSLDEFSPKIIKTIDTMVEQGKKVRIVMPAFPEKSPVRDKTLADVPDMAELLSLQHLNDLCAKITSVYPAGAELVVYTDGFAFANVFPPSHTTEKRTAYLVQLQNMIVKHDFNHIQIINLDGKVDLEKYAETESHLLERLRAPKCESDRNNVILYRGQIHFFTAELKDSASSNTQLKKQAEKIARGVTCMSDALSKYLSQIEPEALRASCHPKTVGADKIGIWFDHDHSIGGTPWHNAAVFDIEPSTRKCIATFKKVHEAKDEHCLLHKDPEGHATHFVSKPVFHAACKVQTLLKTMHARNAKKLAENTAENKVDKRESKEKTATSASTTTAGVRQGGR